MPKHRRQDVLQVALECFSEEGFEATSIERIRDLSGASVGSIYHHFGDKNGIAQALYLEGLRDANARALERLRKARTTQGGVRALVLAFAGWVTDNPQWARYMYGTAAAWVRSAGGELKALDEAYYRELEEWFAPATVRGELRRVSMVAFVAIVYGPVFTYARRWLLGGATAPLKALADQFADAAWQAIRAPRADSRQRTQDARQGHARASWRRVAVPKSTRKERNS